MRGDMECVRERRTHVIFNMYYLIFYKILILKWLQYETDGS